MNKRLSSCVIGFLLLFSSNAFAMEKITTKTNITQVPQIDGGKLSKALNKNLSFKGQSFVNSGSEFGINPIVLASISAHESNWGTSKIASKYNNIFGITHSTKRWSIFNSFDSCIRWTSKMLKENYIDRGYLTLEAIQKIYCPDDPSWAHKVVKISNQIISQIN